MFVMQLIELNQKDKIMTIKLMEKELYNKIVDFQKKHPILTFQNEGYQYVDKTKFTEEDNKAFKEVQTIIGNHITGFISFDNFKISKNNEVKIRFHYNYGADDPTGHSFNGVGYILLEELLNGFKD